MSFVRPTRSELIARVQGDIAGHLSGADARPRRAVLSVLARILAGLADTLHGFAGWLARQLMPDTAEGEYLDRWAAIWGVPRKGAAAATGSLLVTGTTGAIVPAGAELARIDGRRYAVLAATALGAGATMVAVRAIDAGGDGSAPVGTTLTFTSPVSGVGAVATASAGLAGGADQESDAALLARLLTRIRTPPQGGAEVDWIDWTLAVAGVTRAWVYPGWNGAGNVGITFVCDGRANIIPTPADVAAVAAYLAPLRPVAARPVVFAPQQLPVNLIIASVPATAAVRAAVEAQLVDLFAREGAPGVPLLLSHIDEAISLAAGEADHMLYSPAANVVPLPGVMPVLGVVTWA